MAKLSFQTAIHYMHHTTVCMSRLHLQSRYKRCHAIVYAGQHFEKAAMGIKSFSRTVRDHIITSWRRQWMLLGRNRDTNQQEHESGSREILVTRTITQETSPWARPKDPFMPAANTCMEDPKDILCQLVLLAEDNFTPPGSPTGTTLGIPAEHLLDEDPPETSELIQPLPLSFDNPFATPAREWSDDSDSDSTVHSSTGTLSDEPIQPNPPKFDDPFHTPPRTESGSSASDSTVRAATGAFLKENPTNRSPGNVAGRYEMVDSNLVYICNHCGAGTVVGIRDQWEHIERAL